LLAHLRTAYLPHPTLPQSGPAPCSIREKAELKLYSALGKQAKRKRQHMGDLKIVVAGCVAAQEGQTLLRRVPEVDLVMGPHHANR